MQGLSENGRRTATVLIIIIILLLAGLFAFIPNIDYPYPVHGDEWNHLAFARSLVEKGNLDFVDPFTGEVALTLGSVDLMEAGYYVLWSAYQQVTGAPWVPLFVYMPVLIFILTILAVYVLAKRFGFGLEAAFLTCLLPTSVGILGPAFMVPLATGLLFIPLALFVAFHLRGISCYLLILVFTSFLVFMHAPTAIGVAIILVPYIILNIKDRIGHSIGLAVALMVPFLVPFPWIAALITPTAKSLLLSQGLTPWVDLPPLLERFGVLPFIFSFLGIIYLGSKGGKNSFGLILGLLLLVLVLAVYYQFHLGLAVIYERGLVYMQLLLSIVGGAGIVMLQKIPFKPRKLPGAVAPGALTALAAVVILVVTVVPVRVRYDYYHMIDNNDYRAFAWVDRTVDDAYQLALLDPWKASAFTAITGKQICRHIKEYMTSIDDLVYKYLESGCRSSLILSDGGVSIVYNTEFCSNSDLAHVRNNVYLTNPNLSWSQSEPQGVLNKSFEGIRNDGPAEWVHYFENCDPLFLYPQDGHNGGYCVGTRVSSIRPEEGYPAADWFQTVTVEYGQRYSIGGWIRTENVEGYGGAAIVCHWKGRDNISMEIDQFMTPVSGTSQWSYYQGEVLVPDGAQTATIVCILGNSTGSAWFDEIAFESH